MNGAWEQGAQMAETAEEFIAAVRDGGELASDDDALVAIRAVVQTLAERVSGGVMAGAARELPPGLPLQLTELGPASEFDVSLFCRKVAEREGHVDDDVARKHARAVLSEVRETISHQEWRKLEGQLPRDYAELLPG